MILQALTDYYQQLSLRGEIAPQGWGQVKISYALSIDSEGSLQQVICVMEEQTRGKKTVMTPRQIRLPAPVKKTSGVLSNFLWENGAYLLGVDKKATPKKQPNALLPAKNFTRRYCPAWILRRPGRCWPFFKDGILERRRSTRPWGKPWKTFSKEPI